MFYIWPVLIKEAYQLLQSSLAVLYDNRESSNIADLVMEEITGWERSKRIIYNDQPLNDQQAQLYKTYRNALLQGKPVQYVLGYAWFNGMRFSVDERVLIPRPETEELVASVQEHCARLDKDKDYIIQLLDIGTGSGCIAIALKKLFPHWNVWAMDKSSGALEIAKKNAANLEVQVEFREGDILQEAKSDHLPAFDIIVSNPPYIPKEDITAMHKNVLDHEPHLALFVNNGDPLQFYKAIVDFSAHHLLRGGMLFFETHEHHARDVSRLMEANEFEDVEVKKDMQGKERIVMGRKMGASL